MHVPLSQIHPPPFGAFPPFSVDLRRQKSPSSKPQHGSKREMAQLLVGLDHRADHVAAEDARIGLGFVGEELFGFGVDAAKLDVRPTGA